jgi:hypothetical protein
MFVPPVQKAHTHPRPSFLAPPIVHEVVRSPGRPLDEMSLRFFERRLGHDFSNVRVHSDARADASARSVDALAYTLGTNVVFRSGRYAPHTRAGRALLAHELTHVVQAKRSTTGLPQRSPVMDRDHPAERHAADVSAAIERGGPVAIAPVAIAPFASVGLARRPVAADTALSAAELIDELEKTIAVAKMLPERTYKAFSGENYAHAGVPDANAERELTGLARLTTLAPFATAFREIQANWPKRTPDERVADIGKAAVTQLEAVGVPGFKKLAKEKMTPAGMFDKSKWKFSVNERYMADPPHEPTTEKQTLLPDREAGDLANTTLHESRHAEQDFLAARFAAGRRGRMPVLNALAVSLKNRVPLDVAEKAVAKKLDSKHFDPASADRETVLAENMFRSTVTEGRENQGKEDFATAAHDDLKTQIERCETALGHLRSDPSSLWTRKATARLEALNDAMTAFKEESAMYRNIPHEADAHKVGDAAESAFNRTNPAPKKQ